ncbi:MAG TPA: DUF1289 domain-containing protein [Burkholderiales bacterium]|nr:DUF1289 domain-containing protein [Burkholderiales bacterium]
MSGEGRDGSASRPAQPEPETPPISAHSPCIGICLLDDNGYCIGCGRTAAQIAALPPEPESR